MPEKKILIIIVLLGLISVGVWIFGSTRPKAGIQVANLGRGHVSIGTVENYNSNPPTSGPHYEQWTKWGVYDVPKDDRILVHSLEHGYIIMSYNCDFHPQKSFIVKDAQAKDNAQTDLEKRQINEASDSAGLPESFKSTECQELINNLRQVYDEKGQVRLIVIPRPGLDARIGLTAWTYIDKFNDFDKVRIAKFITDHLNQGPEKTME